MADLGDQNRAEAMSDLGHRVEDHGLSDPTKDPELDSTTEQVLDTTPTKKAFEHEEKESGEITDCSPTRDGLLPILHSTPQAAPRD